MEALTSSTMPGPIIGIGEVLWDMLPAGPRAGGAPFNFAFHCQQLGYPAIIVSRVGDDELGRDLRKEVRLLGLSDEFIQVDPDHPTGTVQVQVDAQGQPSYTIVENVAWDYLDWSDSFNPLIMSARAVCFGTLAQRSRVSRETIRRFVVSPKSNQVNVCDLNLRPPFVDADIIEKSIRLCSWLKLNEGEWNEIARSKNLPSPRRVLSDSKGSEEWLDLKKLSSWFRLLNPLVCITRGEKGCSVWTIQENVEVPGIPIKVADTVGAGDAFTAGLLTQMLEGRSLAESARFANARSGPRRFSTRRHAEDRAGGGGAPMLNIDWKPPTLDTPRLLLRRSTPTMLRTFSSSVPIRA